MLLANRLPQLHSATSLAGIKVSCIKISEKENLPTATGTFSGVRSKLCSAAWFIVNIHAGSFSRHFHWSASIDRSWQLPLAVCPPIVQRKRTSFLDTRRISRKRTLPLGDARPIHCQTEICSSLRAPPVPGWIQIEGSRYFELFPKASSYILSVSTIEKRRSFWVRKGRILIALESPCDNTLYMYI